MFESHKVLFYSILMIFLISGCNDVNREDVVKDAGSTNLSEENISGIRPGMVITDEDFFNQHGYFYPHPHNDDETSSAPPTYYDLLWNDEEYIIRVDKNSREVLLILAPEDPNADATTMYGVKIGTPVDDVIALYGENYYVYEDNHQGLYEIGYVDHQNNLIISFVHFDNKVTNISLAFVSY